MYCSSYLPCCLSAFSSATKTHYCRKSTCSEFTHVCRCCFCFKRSYSYSNHYRSHNLWSCPLGNGWRSMVNPSWIFEKIICLYSILFFSFFSPFIFSLSGKIFGLEFFFYLPHYLPIFSVYRFLDFQQHSLNSCLESPL